MQSILNGIEDDTLRGYIITELVSDKYLLTNFQVIDKYITALLKEV